MEKTRDKKILPLFTLLSALFIFSCTSFNCYSMQQKKTEEEGKIEEKMGGKILYFNIKTIGSIAKSLSDLKESIPKIYTDLKTNGEEQFGDYLEKSDTWKEITKLKEESDTLITNLETELKKNQKEAASTDLIKKKEAVEEYFHNFSKIKQAAEAPDKWIEIFNKNNENITPINFLIFKGFLEGSIFGIENEIKKLTEEQQKVKCTPSSRPFLP
ncbi:MAG: hypothetical protein ABH827_02815 [bacterium]